jgi:hypothetical protein
MQNNKEPRKFYPVILRGKSFNYKKIIKTFRIVIQVVLLVSTIIGVGFYFFCETKEIKASSQTETLRPNGAGSETGEYIKQSGAGEHWDKVDEVEADDNSTYIYLDAVSAGGNWQRDLYALPAHTGSGTINSVTVYARLKDIYGSNSSGKISIKTNGTVYDTSAFALTTSWATKSNVWATNPQTGVAWTWDEIDALEAGVSLYERVVGSPPFCILKGQSILMANGSQKNIEDIHINDEVISFDLNSEKTEIDKVTQVLRGGGDDYLIFNHTLKTSTDHIIWASGEFKPAEEIKVGDFLLDSNGNEVKITQIEYVQEKVETYDLVVEKNHNFFASNYLVHNDISKAGFATQVYVEVDYTPISLSPQSKDFIVSVAVLSEITISAPSNVTMTPAIYGMTGNLGNPASGSTLFTVKTNNATGFNLTVQASTTPALSTGTYNFADYAPVSPGTPDYAWQSPAASTTGFGFAVGASGTSGGDATQAFKYTGSTCNSSGGTNSSTQCWLNLNGTTPITVVNRTTNTGGSGVVETLVFRAESNAAFLVEDTYSATITVTAATN